MAASGGVVLRQSARYSTSFRSDFEIPESKSFVRSVPVKQKKRPFGVLSCGFRDQGHLQYYDKCSVKLVSEKREEGTEKIAKMKKKQKKLVNDFRKDLMAFSVMGLGLGVDSGLLGEVKTNIISEAAELLLERLQKVRSELKELKRKMKEEKSRSKAAHKLKHLIDSESSSSSSESSSESSDSDCGEVVNMKTLKHPLQKQIVVPEQNIVESILPTAPSKCPSHTSWEDTSLLIPSNVENDPFSETTATSVKIVNTSNENVEDSVTLAKRVEVCMGGKCKKSGATAILEEFQRALGIEAGSVSGCKCMGKCRSAPNVKVSNNREVEDDSVSNSLCIGVGLEDVSTIVANLLGGGGEDPNKIGLAASG